MVAAAGDVAAACSSWRTGMRKNFAVIALFVLGIVLPCRGQVPYGVEFQVNTYKNDSQDKAQIAALSGGDFVVCWQSYEQDGAGWGVYGQLFSAQGEKVGSEFQVNTYSNDSQLEPQIASLLGGGFVLCWTSYGQNGFEYGSYGQLFGPSGERIGNEFRAGSYPSSFQNDPYIAPLSNGGFVICWSGEGREGLGIYGQKFSASGEKVGDEFRASSSAAKYQMRPIISLLSEGNFVICWESEAQDGSALGVYGQLLSAVGDKIGSEFQVNSYTSGYQQKPSIAPLFGGGFVICWESWFQDGSGSGIYGQLFSKNAEKMGSEFMVNSYTNNNQRNPKTTNLSKDVFGVCWESNEQDGSNSGIYGQLFLTNGHKLGSEFQVNSYVWSVQFNPIPSPLKDGNFVICWESIDQDGSGGGIYAQLFSETGKRIGNEFRVNTYTLGDQKDPLIAPLSGGDFVICWDNGDQDIYAKRFPSAALLRHNLRIFILLEPASDASLISTAPILCWQSAIGKILCFSWEVQYKILYDDNSEFSSPDTVRVDGDTTVVLQNLQPGTTYFWKVLAKNLAGDSLWSSNTNAFFVRHDATLVENNEAQPPGQFVLQQNYPNPFNPETTIRYELSGSGFVTVKVFDITGRLVKVLVSGWQTMGTQNTIWDGADFDGNLVAAGIYICQVEFMGEDGRKMVQSRKMSLVK